jgi:hypothetical protein
MQTRRTFNARIRSLSGMSLRTVVVLIIGVVLGVSACCQDRDGTMGVRIGAFTPATDADVDAFLGSDGVADLRAGGSVLLGRGGDLTFSAGFFLFLGKLGVRIYHETSLRLSDEAKIPSLGVEMDVDLRFPCPERDVRTGLLVSGRCSVRVDTERLFKGESQ